MHSSRKKQPQITTGLWITGENAASSLMDKVYSPEFTAVVKQLIDPVLKITEDIETDYESKKDTKEYRQVFSYVQQIFREYDERNLKSLLKDSSESLEVFVLACVIRMGHMQAFEFVLQREFDPNQLWKEPFIEPGSKINYIFYSLLSAATFQRRHLMIQKLIEKGVKVDLPVDGGSALQIALQIKDTHAVEMLLAHETNLARLDVERQGKLLEFLIDSKKLANWLPKMTQRGIAREVLNQALHLSARRGDVENAEQLILNGADVNYLQKNTRPEVNHELFPPLTTAMTAPVDKVVEMVTCILRHQPTLTFSEDLPIRTPLFDAARLNHVDVVKILLGCGVDPRKASRDLGSPICAAAGVGNLEILALFQDYLDIVSANIEPDSLRNTPLYAAIISGKRSSIKSIEWLLDRQQIHPFAYYHYLCIAFEWGDTEKCRLMLKRQNVEIPAYVRDECAWLAAMSNSFPRLELLLAKNEDANIADSVITRLIIMLLKRRVRISELTVLIDYLFLDPRKINQPMLDNFLKAFFEVLEEHTIPQDLIEAFGLYDLIRFMVSLPVDRLLGKKADNAKCLKAINQFVDSISIDHPKNVDLRLLARIYDPERVAELSASKKAESSTNRECIEMIWGCFEPRLKMQTHYLAAWMDQFERVNCGALSDQQLETLQKAVQHFQQHLALLATIESVFQSALANDADARLKWDINQRLLGLATIMQELKQFASGTVRLKHWESLCAKKQTEMLNRLFDLVSAKSPGSDSDILKNREEAAILIEKLPPHVLSQRHPKRETTLLIDAILLNRHDVVEKLLNKKVDPSITVFTVYDKNVSGKSASNAYIAALDLNKYGLLRTLLNPSIAWDSSLDLAIQSPPGVSTRSAPDKRLVEQLIMLGLPISQIDTSYLFPAMQSTQSADENTKYSVKLFDEVVTKYANGAFHGYHRLDVLPYETESFIQLLQDANLAIMKFRGSITELGKALAGFGTTKRFKSLHEKYQDDSRFKATCILDHDFELFELLFDYSIMKLMHICNDLLKQYDISHDTFHDRLKKMDTIERQALQSFLLSIGQVGDLCQLVFNRIRDDFSAIKFPNLVRLDLLTNLSVRIQTFCCLINGGLLSEIVLYEEKQAGRQQPQKKSIDAKAKAVAEANQKAKAEAERKAKAEAERKAKAEAERKAKAEAERKAKAKAEQKAKAEADQKARAKAELEQKAKLEAEQKAKLEAEQKAKAEAEQKAKAEVEQKAKAEAEQKAKAEVEQKAKAEAEQKAKVATVTTVQQETITVKSKRSTVSSTTPTGASSSGIRILKRPAPNAEVVANEKTEAVSGTQLTRLSLLASNPAAQGKQKFDQLNASLLNLLEVLAHSVTPQQINLLYQLVAQLNDFYHWQIQLESITDVMINDIRLLMQRAAEQLLKLSQSSQPVYQLALLRCRAICLNHLLQMRKDDFDLVLLTASLDSFRSVIRFHLQNAPDFGVVKEPVKIELTALFYWIGVAQQRGLITKPKLAAELPIIQKMDAVQRHFDSVLAKTDSIQTKIKTIDAQIAHLREYLLSIPDLDAGTHAIAKACAYHKMAEASLNKVHLSNSVDDKFAACDQARDLFNSIIDNARQYFWCDAAADLTLIQDQILLDALTLYDRMVSVMTEVKTANVTPSYRKT